MASDKALGNSNISGLGGRLIRERGYKPAKETKKEVQGHKIITKGGRVKEWKPEACLDKLVLKTGLASCLFLRVFPLDSAT